MCVCVRARVLICMFVLLFQTRSNIQRRWPVINTLCLAYAVRCMQMELRGTSVILTHTHKHTDTQTVAVLAVRWFNNNFFKPCCNAVAKQYISEWSFPICLTPNDRKQNVLSASLNKTCPSFLVVECLQVLSIFFSCLSIYILSI